MNGEWFLKLFLAITINHPPHKTNRLGGFIIWRAPLILGGSDSVHPYLGKSLLFRGPGEKSAGSVMRIPSSGNEAQSGGHATGNHLQELASSLGKVSAPWAA